MKRQIKYDIFILWSIVWKVKVGKVDISYKIMNYESFMLWVKGGIEGYKLYNLQRQERVQWQVGFVEEKEENVLCREFFFSMK